MINNNTNTTTMLFNTITLLKNINTIATTTTSISTTIIIYNFHDFLR